MLHLHINSAMEVEEDRALRMEPAQQSVEPVSWELKQKQTQNILSKIQTLLTVVEPIHEVVGEDSDSDMAELAQEIDTMDI